jgi:signal transduction histidine kinase
LSAKTTEIVALVDRAAAMITATGGTVFPELRQTGDDSRTGYAYLFVVDMNGNVLLNAVFPKLEGTNVIDVKDSRGKLVVVEWIRAARSGEQAGWVSCMWPKAGQTRPAQRWSYVKAVQVDGTRAFVGASFYPE